MMSLYGFGAPQFYDPVVDTGQPKGYRVGAGARAGMETVRAGDNGQTHTATTRDPLLRLQASTPTTAAATPSVATDAGQDTLVNDGSTVPAEMIATKMAPPLPLSKFGLTDLLIVLGLVGAGTGAYFLFRKKKPKAGVAGARRRRR